MTYYSTEYASPIGQMTLACNEDGKLVGLWLAGQKYFLGGISPVPRDGLPIFAQTEDWLNRYFAGLLLHCRWLLLAVHSVRRSGKSFVRFPMGKSPPTGKYPAALLPAGGWSGCPPRPWAGP